MWLLDLKNSCPSFRKNIFGYDQSKIGISKIRLKARKRESEDKMDRKSFEAGGKTKQKNLDSTPKNIEKYKRVKLVLL